MQKVGILYHPLVDATRAKAEEIREFLEARKLTAWCCSSWKPEEVKARLNGTELVLTVGGDGTILRAAQAIFPEKIPITGINMGRLGFMTELGADEALEKLPDLLAGKGWLDERTTLEATLTGGGARQSFTALNDVVAARGAVARVVHFTVDVDGQFFRHYRADGVILATATGSTGYSLSAGGPVLYPRSGDIILVPIVPHLSPGYPLVLPAKTTVKIKIAAVHEATLSIDGHINVSLTDSAEITVRQGPHRAQFLRIHNQADFYRSLEQKLEGKK